MARSLNITLQDDVEQFVTTGAALSHEGNASGFVESLLREQMRLGQLPRELQAGIERGLIDLEAGRFVTLDSDGLRADFEALCVEGRQRLAEKP